MHFITIKGWDYDLVLSSELFPLGSLLPPSEKAAPSTAMVGTDWWNQLPVLKQGTKKFPEDWWDQTGEPPRVRSTRVGVRGRMAWGWGKGWDGSAIEAGWHGGWWVQMGSWQLYPPQVCFIPWISPQRVHLSPYVSKRRCSLRIREAWTKMTRTLYFTL